MVVGTALPIGLLIAVSDSSIIDILSFVFYVVSPMYTLYVTNFTIVANFLLVNGITVTSPTFFGLDATLGFSVGMYFV